ncbi:hypothetical protein CK203_113645 [Vitis vinifera]|uniref:Uncharacterized protein n=1 Tax=Vitis vinifera TaxID=29760 RepID=A0A438FEU5_VITVI|nr:hypothetical protein CK203_113645 [Vitis vinifera]
MGKPSAHSLTVTSRVLHHMICSILLPRGGHRDEVSYLEAFIVDSILTGRRIHVGYLIMMHMISYVESSTRVLPMAASLPMLSRMPGRGGGRDQRDEDGLDPQRDFEHRGPELDIPPPHQSEGIHVEATFSEPMMIERPSQQSLHLSHHLLSYHLRHLMFLIMRLGWISPRRSAFLGLRIEERMDQQQATFDHLEQRMDRIESRQASQHEEMMAYLRSMFPPPPPQP